MTSDTPTAFHGAPASSGRCAVAEAGRVLPTNFRVADAGLFEDCAAFKNARATTPAFSALPAVLGELAAAVTFLQSRADAVLQGFQVSTDFIERIHGGYRIVQS